MLFKLFKTKLFYFLPLILITQTLMADESVNQSSSAEVNSLTIDEIIVTAETVSYTHLRAHETLR